ncbi:MAG TPA: hypothetical protein VGM98_24060 [Schlesneria sp.]
MNDTQVSAKGIDVLKHLKHLSIKRARVGDEGMTSIARISSLEELSVGGEITNAGLRELSKSQTLVTLVIDSEVITGEGLEALCRIPTLKEIRASNFKVRGVADEINARLQPNNQAVHIFENK